MASSWPTAEATGACASAAGVLSAGRGWRRRGGLLDRHDDRGDHGKVCLALLLGTWERGLAMPSGCPDVRRPRLVGGGGGRGSPMRPPAERASLFHRRQGGGAGRGGLRSGRSDRSRERLARSSNATRTGAGAPSRARAPPRPPRESKDVGQDWPVQCLLLGFVESNALVSSIAPGNDGGRGKAVGSDAIRIPPGLPGEKSVGLSESAIPPQAVCVRHDRTDGNQEVRRG